MAVADTFSGPEKSLILGNREFNGSSMNKKMFPHLPTSKENNYHH